MSASVSTAGPRTGIPSGWRGRLSDSTSRHRSITIIVGMALVTALLPVIVVRPPFSSFQGLVPWVNCFANAGVFVLLALGLNVATAPRLPRGSVEGANHALRWSGHCFRDARGGGDG